MDKKKLSFPRRIRRETYIRIHYVNGKREEFWPAWRIIFTQNSNNLLSNSNFGNAWVKPIHSGVFRYRFPFEFFVRWQMGIHSFWILKPMLWNICVNTCLWLFITSFYVINIFTINATMPFNYKFWDIVHVFMILPIIRTEMIFLQIFAEAWFFCNWIKILWMIGNNDLDGCDNDIKRCRVHVGFVALDVPIELIEAVIQFFATLLWEAIISSVFRYMFKNSA